jgi:hypothetical protein
MIHLELFAANSSVLKEKDLQDFVIRRSIRCQILRHAVVGL